MLPDAGDIAWVVFDPALGTEQAGRRPALILSDISYHERSTRAVVCPITKTARDWPFDVPLPSGLMTEGFVLTDQIRTIHRTSRIRQHIETAPAALLNEVRGRVAALLGLTEDELLMAGPKLYYSPGACSLAPHIALEETGAPFEPVRVDFGTDEQRKPDYLAVNPKGRVPALADDGIVVTENPAVLRYVARKFPSASLWPDDPRDEARCLEWLGWCASGIHVAYAHIRRAERYAATDAGRADVVETGRKTTRQVWEQVEAKLAASRSIWAAGQRYSVADPYLLVFWNWGRGPTLGYDMKTDFPAWTAHAGRMVERPAVRRVLEREGVALP